MNRLDMLYGEWTAIKCHSDAGCPACPNTVECHRLIDAIKIVELEIGMGDSFIDIGDLLEQA